MILQGTFALWNVFTMELWGISIAVFFFCGGLYINRTLKTETGTEKPLLVGFSTILIGYGFFCFIAKLNDLNLPGSFSNGTFYGNYNNLEPINEFLM